MGIFYKVAPLAAFSVCGRFGCRLPDPRKKEKEPKRKKYYQILYLYIYKYILSFTIYMLKFFNCQKLEVLVFADGILPGSIPC